MAKKKAKKKESNADLLASVDYNDLTKEIALRRAEKPVITPSRYQRVGGSFAPPLTDELLDKYEDLADQKGGPIGEAMLSLAACCRKWWNLPDSEGLNQSAHPSGVGMIIPLDDHIKKVLDEHIPWEHELTAMQNLFDELPNNEVRNAAFHLLWHVKELNLDREPITNDLLQLE